MIIAMLMKLNIESMNLFTSRVFIMVSLVFLLVKVKSQDLDRYTMLVVVNAFFITFISFTTKK